MEWLVPKLEDCGELDISPEVSQGQTAVNLSRHHNAVKVTMAVQLPTPDLTSLVPQGERVVATTGSYGESQWLYMDSPGVLTIVRHLPTEQNWANCIRLTVDLASRSATRWERGGEIPPGAYAAVDPSQLWRSNSGIGPLPK